MSESAATAACDSHPVLEPEWLDRPDLPAAARRRAVADLRRVNRFLFGRRAAVRAVMGELSGGDSAPLLLDVAAGAGDVGAAVGRAAARRGVPLGIVALDRELSHLLLGRRWGEVRSGVVARAEALPFRDGAFDLTLSTLFFHHLDAGGKARVSVEMVRVARRGALIVDLVRSRWAALALRALSPLLLLGRIARADGLTSIDRAWTFDRWSAFFLSEAGEELPAGVTIDVHRRFPARVSIALRRPA